VRIGDAVDGFRLAYDDHPADDHPADDHPADGHPADGLVAGGRTVVLLHGWPGDRHDHRAVVRLLAGRCRVLVPDLRGFGGSTSDGTAEASAYGADGQARSVLGLVEALGVGPVVLGGYDVGSRVAQAAARARPDLVRALVLAPPLPGAGQRVLTPAAQREFWYQSFHRLPLSTQLIDGSPDAARTYLTHFWSHWSGPAYEPDPAELDRLARLYGRPGAFVSSLNWYRAGSGTVATALQERPPAERVAVPTTVLWPEHDPLFPQAWSDRLGDWFAELDLRLLPGVGHFVPLEAPETFDEAVRERLAP
jgi:pimeloyl-ACP methyl ester carboxylesterase